MNILKLTTNNFNMRLLFLLGLAVVTDNKKVWSNDEPFVITTILTAPFMMVSGDSGSGQYEGFLIDLWSHINKRLGIQNFKIQAVADGKYGYYNVTTGEWNGMIGEIVNQKVHMALAPLKRTNQRGSVVDFTHIYMTVGGSVLLKKNLHIHSLDALMRSDVTVGCVQSGSTKQLLEDSSSGTWMNRLYKRLLTKSQYVATNREGTSRALKEDFAFIGETPSLEYITNQDNDLSMIHIPDYPEDGYGIAVREDSSITEQLNPIIDDLLQNGVIDELYDKWWHSNKKYKGGHYTTSGGSHVTSLHITAVTLLAIFFQ